MPLPWCCWCKIRGDIDLSHRRKISGVGHIGNERGRGVFRANGAGGADNRPERCWGAGPRNPLCAFLLPRENSATGGASGKSAKRMSGCARCRPLEPLSRQACGCMSETLVRICSPSAEACQATQTHFLVRAGKSRRVQGSEDEISYSLTQARAFPSQASRPFEVPARHGRQARSTQLQLACGQLTLLPPRFEPRAGKEPVTVWVIRVWEEQAPDGEEPKDRDLGDLGTHHDA
jgi:hypothetical protein